MQVKLNYAPIYIRTILYAKFTVKSDKSISSDRVKKTST